MSPGDPEPLIVQNAGGSSPHLLVCDHSGRAIPRRLGDLGLAPADFDRHIAWDIGAGAVAVRLGQALDACVARQAYSRLVIDCNRAPDREDAIPEVSDGTPIPANAGLSAADVQARVEEVHAPYHAGISAVLDARRAQGRLGAVISVHSFTPVMNDVARPWHVGVLHGGDSPLSHRMLSLLGAERDLVVGDNQPYSLGEIDYTVPVHAQQRGLDYLELEIRQDLIADVDGQVRMAALLARLLKA